MVALGEQLLASDITPLEKFRRLSRRLMRTIADDLPELADGTDGGADLARRALAALEGVVLQERRLDGIERTAVAAALRSSRSRGPAPRPPAAGICSPVACRSIPCTPP